ncbi:uncharacterized protein [Rhodnius prolixus]|uniref:WD_REPEATS_REGION domain-containing protein n=1 Tax=Rhodnius prolixus TaxID=13249 RepID=T1I619_RHOPR
MKLSKFLLRYFPPGIALEYVSDGILEKKMIDLFHLTPSTKLEELVQDIMKQQPIVTERVKSQLLASLKKLQKKLIEEASRKYILHKSMHHVLPVTNVVFSKEGNRCLTGSFDRTCKMWDVDSGELYLTLDGHNNVVYDVSFNLPYSDRVLTASFDKTACVWNSDTGERLLTMWGHEGELVVIKYDNSRQHVATGSMDQTARVFDINTGLELWMLDGHKNAIIRLEYSNDGRQILTGSFDSKVFLWDVNSKRIITKFIGHKKPITNCKFNFDCSVVATSSLDGTVKLYDLKTTKCRSTIYHGEDVLDMSFDSTGKKLVTCGTDGICKVWNVECNISPTATLLGHEAEISQACFSPGGVMVLTGSNDGTARLWNSVTGDCCQVLTGHTDEIFSCGFTYDGNTIITASKDNTCQLWKARSGQKEQEEGVNNKTNVTTSLDFECTGTMSV